MKHPVFLLIPLLLLNSCGKKASTAEEKPDWLLEESKMADIITDLRIVDAATYSNTNSPPRNKAKDWYFVMKKHGVEDSIFRKSHDYYAGHPETSEKIYEQVIDKISLMQAEYADGH